MPKHDPSEILVKMQEPLPSVYTSPVIVAQHMAWRLVEAMGQTQSDTWPPQTEAEMLRLADLIGQCTGRILEPITPSFEGDEFEVDDEDES